MESMTSSMTPLGVVVDLSTSCSIVLVFLRVPWRLSLNMVSLFMALIVAPNSMRVIGTIISLTCTSNNDYQDPNTLGK